MELDTLIQTEVDEIIDNFLPFVNLSGTLFITSRRTPKNRRLNKRKTRVMSVLFHN